MRRNASPNELPGFHFPPEAPRPGAMAAPGAGAGGGESSPEGEACRECGRREENQRCGFVWVFQRLPPLFVAASSLARWLFLWSCFSNFILNPSFKATCSFSQGAKPCHAFKYLTKCFRGSGQQKQHLGCFPLAIYFFYFLCIRSHFKAPCIYLQDSLDS